MLLALCKSKIHKAYITKKELEYSGSIGIDSTLMRKASIRPDERVQVLNMNTGGRFETYCIAEEEGSGTIALYGPAARLGEIGDRVIIISYGLMTDEEAQKSTITTVYVDEQNRPLAHHA